MPPLPPSDPLLVPDLREQGPKKETVNQPTAAPTRKGIALAIAGGLTAAAFGITEALAGAVPSLAFLQTPGITELISVGAAAAGFYITKEWAISS